MSKERLRLSFDSTKKQDFRTFVEQRARGNTAEFGDRAQAHQNFNNGLLTGLGIANSHIDDSNKQNSRAGSISTSNSPERVRANRLGPKERTEFQITLPRASVDSGQNHAVLDGMRRGSHNMQQEMSFYPLENQSKASTMEQIGQFKQGVAVNQASQNGVGSILQTSCLWSRESPQTPPRTVQIEPEDQQAAVYHEQNDLNFEGGGQQNQMAHEASDYLNAQRNKTAGGSPDQETLKSFKKSPEKPQMTLDQSIQKFRENKSKSSSPVKKIVQIDRDDPNSEVFSWGCDRFGQLGLGKIHQETAARGEGLKSFNLPQPRFCQYGVAIKFISCGDEHSAFVTALNHIYTMGSNRSGQLGIRDPMIDYKYSPVLIEQMMGHQIEGISCGGSHTVAFTSRGEAYAWGEGRYGALGVPDTETDQFRPQKVIFQENASSYKKQVFIKAASAGHKHTSFLDERGRVFACGNNDNGQLGLATRSVQQQPLQIDNFEHNAVQVSAGKDHTLILTDTGLVYACGSNSSGQLGVTSEHKSSITPMLVEDISHIPMSFVEAGTFSASIAQKSGSIYLWGTGTFGTFNTPHRVKRVAERAIQVSIGDSFGIILTENRKLYTWGTNSSGQLGTGDLEDRPTPLMMQQITSEGRMIRQVAAGKNSVLCIGISTGLTVMDEQRMALEKRINELEKKQASEGPDVHRDEKRRKTSRKRKAKEEFRQALFDNKSDHSKTGAADKSQRSNNNIKKSRSSMMKGSTSKIHSTLQSQQDPKVKREGMLQKRSVSRGRYAKKNQAKSKEKERKSQESPARSVSRGKMGHSSKRRVEKSSRHPSDVLKIYGSTNEKGKRQKSADQAAPPSTISQKQQKQKRQAIAKKQKIQTQRPQNRRKPSISKRSEKSVKTEKSKSQEDLNRQSQKSSEPRLETTLQVESHAVVQNQQSQPSINLEGHKMSGADLSHIVATDHKPVSQFDSAGKSTIKMSPELQNTQKIENQPSQLSQEHLDSSSHLEVANPFKRTTPQLGSKIKLAQEQSDSKPPSPPPQKESTSQLSVGRHINLNQNSNDSAQSQKDAPPSQPPAMDTSARVQEGQQPSINSTYHQREQTQLSQRPAAPLNNMSQSASEIGFEGGDRSSRDGVIDMNIRLQAENKSLKGRLDFLEGEKAVMLIEMQQLKDRERIAVDDGLFKDTRLQGLESELAAVKLERARAHEDLAHERAKITDLAAQLQTSAYKIQNMTTQVEQVEGLTRSLAQLREENLRLQDVDTHLRVAKQQNLEQEEQIRKQRDQMAQMDHEIGKRSMEIQEKDDALRMVDADVRDMQAQLEKEEKSRELVHHEKENLHRELEALGNVSAQHKQMQTQYENERQMRINSEGDIARMREQLADQMATSLKEKDNLRRAIDEMKYQNEESVRQINVKNEEIESLMDQMDGLAKIIEKKEFAIADLKASVLQLEMKNRKLNETVNKAIYGRTQSNIDKTMDVLKRRGANQDPERIKKQKAYGINPTSDMRLQELMKEEAFTTENALKQLENKKKQEEMVSADANARTPYNDPARSTSRLIEHFEHQAYDGSEYIMPYQRTDQFNAHLPYAQAPGSDMTPLQADIRAGHVDHQNWQDTGSRALYPGKEVESGVYEHLPNGARGGRALPDDEASPDIVRLPKTEEDVIRNRAQTIMTSRMIQNSLANLRTKLNQMQDNKKAVQRGMEKFDAHHDQ